MDQIHLVAIVLQRAMAEAWSMSRDHQSCGIGLLLSNPGESSLGSESPVDRCSCYPPVGWHGEDCGHASSRAAPGRGGYITIGTTHLAVLHPAVLKVNSEAARLLRRSVPAVPRRDRVGSAHQLAVLDGSDPARRTEAQVVSAERCSCQSKAVDSVRSAPQRPGSRRLLRDHRDPLRGGGLRPRWRGGTWRARG